MRRGMDVVIAEVLTVVMVVVLAATSYYFFRQTIGGTIGVSTKRTAQVFETIAEELQIVGVNKNNITVLNKGDSNITIVAIYLDSNKLNYTPKIVPANTLMEINTSEVIYDPISGVRAGDKVTIISQRGNKWEYNIPSTTEKVDEILTLSDFDVVNGTWTQDDYITGSI